MSFRFVLLFLFSTLSAVLSAQCTTEAGSFTQSELALCPDGSGEVFLSISPGLYTGGTLDIDDVVAFYFSTESTFDPDNFEFVLRPFDTQSFTLTQTGYLFAVVGSFDLGTLPDLDDPCLQIADAPLLLVPGTTFEAEVVSVSPSTQCSGVGLGNGSLQVSVFGAGAPLTWSFSNGSTISSNSGIFNGFGAGNYTVTITSDALNGCERILDFEIPGFAPTVQLFPDAGCDQDGIIVSAVTGGTAPYTYLWSDGSTQPNLTGDLTSGTYTLTVTDTNNCASSKSTTINNSGIPLNVAITGPDEYDCLADGQLEVQLTGGTPPYYFYWNNNASYNATLNLPGPGTYSVTIIDNNECNATATYTVAPGPQPDPVAIDSTTNLDCNGNPGLVYGSFDPDYDFDYFLINAPWPISYPTDSTFVIEIGDDNIYVIEWGYGPNATCLVGGTDYQVTYGPQGCATISGNVLRDQDDNCTAGTSDTPLAGRLVRATGSVERFAFSQSDGSYQLFMPPNETVELEIVSDHTLYVNCNQPLTITTPDVGQTTTTDLLQQTLADCPLLDVNFSAGIVRRCFNVPFYGSVCNVGTVDATNAYVDVELDPLYTVDSSNVVLINLGDGLYRIDLGTLAEEVCFNWVIYTTLSCDATLGRTLCSQASAFPNDPCPEASPDWNGASVSVSGSCTDGQNRFTIANAGTGDMLVPSGYIVIEDAVVLMQEPVDFQLPQGESIEVAYDANGGTFRLEAAQVPDHPGLSMPSFTIEGCGTNDDGTSSTGFFLQFPLDDLYSTTDLECREVIGAYDPNDITAFPRGYGDEHLIEPATPLEYLIRFQNTGTDTAFNVYVEVVMDAGLDLTTLRPLVSSHDYTVEFLEGDTVHFVFDNILLVDSLTNEPGSHGFIRYTVDMEENLPLGTVIEAAAGIYFDFNEPVPTNTVFHTLGEDFVTVTGTQEVFAPGVTVESFPNPTTGWWSLELRGAVPPVASYELRDVSGKLLLTRPVRGGRLRTDLSHLETGVYLYRVVGPTGVMVAGKLIVTR